MLTAEEGEVQKFIVDSCCRSVTRHVVHLRNGLVPLPRPVQHLMGVAAAAPVVFLHAMMILVQVFGCDWPRC